MLSTRLPVLSRAGIGAASALLLVPTILLAQAGSVDSRVKRTVQATEAELIRELRSVAVEIDIHDSHGDMKGMVAAVRPGEPANGQPRRRSSPSHTLAILKRRKDVKGLPLLDEPDCRKAISGARLMEQVSNTVRETTAQYLIDRDSSLAVRHAKETDLVYPLAKVAFLYSPSEVTTLVQMFQPQGPSVRRELVKLLAKWDDPQAGALLAKFAVFDLSPEVRASAIAALRKLPANEYRQVLLDGLRYPWPPVADHAAEALAAIRDRDAAADLVPLLDKPDPRRPYFDDNKRPMKAELVAVNHLRNCLLCHAPSFDASDPLRGMVPEPGRPLAPRYYESDRSQTIFARADITYLRQDFSVFQPVAKADPWPNEQRFDYLIRRRETTVGDVKNELQAGNYPQREAVLFALRELTGEDRGTTSAEWRASLTPKGAVTKR
jgi:hypothetical protein